MSDIRVPELGDVEEVEIIEICVNVGDVVSRDDPVVVIESDKASMEVPAGQDGTITSIAVSLGDRVSEGSLLAQLDPASSEAKPSESSQPSAEPAEPAQQAEPGARSGEPKSTEAGGPARAAGETSEAPRDVTVTLPDVGDAKEVVVIEIIVAVGDEVGSGDPLLVVESDKASMEIPATADGVVTELLVAVEQSVNTGDPLVRLAASGTATVASPKQRPPETPDEHAPRVQQRIEAAAPPDATTVPETQPNTDVYAGPAVRRIAREFGVDLSQVKGSGARGRILKEDVQGFVKGRLQAPQAVAGSSGSGIPRITLPDFSRFGSITIEPLSRIRRAGAENLHRSWLNVPHVTQHDDADVTDLEVFRQSLKDEAGQRGVKVTPLSFLVKAVCASLKLHPRLNASLDADLRNFILKNYFHIGFAVDTPDGLVVPVIRNADQLGIWDLSAVITELADKARNGKLGMADMQGGTFSISSLGAIGGTGFTPIVNAPEVAILGVGRLTKKPQWNGREFEPRDMLPLSLSYDHRAVNGAEAGRFVADLRATLADLRRLVL
ncbi:MAG: dihydrolipoyllysine-residue acetyltransferase [Pseudomonadales bacterium]